MKKKTVLFVLMFLVTVFACLNSFGDDKGKYGFYVPGDNEELYGTWVNTTYTGMPWYPQKIEMYDWGVWEEYSKVTDAFFIQGTFIIVDKWTDSEGNVGIRNSSGRDMSCTRCLRSIESARAGLYGNIFLVTMVSRQRII